MRVLLDLRCLDTASARRGVGRYAAELAKALMREAPGGFSFAGLSFTGIAGPLGLEDVRCPGPRRGIGWTDRFVLPPLFVRNDVDLYHATAYALPALTSARPATVLTVHDLVADVFPAAVSRRHRLAFRRTFRSAVGADRVITVSEATRRDLLQRYDVVADRVAVVPNGVTSAFRGSDSVSATPGWPAPYLLYVGGLDPLKNVPFLLGVLGRARRRVPDLRLVVVGEEGPRRDELAAEARSFGLDGVVHLEGYITDERLSAAYRSASAFVFPSRYEGFGLPPLEAMAAGCPVVSSPAGSLAEVLSDAALLCAPDDEPAWADAVTSTVMDPSLRRRLVDAGLARAAGFTWEAAARRTLEVYAAAAFVVETS